MLSTTSSVTPLFLDAQKDALEMVVKGAPLGDVLAFLTRVVEEEAGRQVVASILLLDDEGRLRIGAAPSLPEDYLGAIDGLTADPGVGTCSAAAATGQVVVTRSFADDSAWAALRHLPLALGLHSAWSQPIVDRHGRVLGTFGTYFRECREPSESERQVVGILSHTAALAIERARAEERQRDSERRKDEFIATLSHELRNPLAPLRTALQLLASRAEDAGSVRALQARMSRQVEQLVRLVDDLLEVSRITRGDLELRREVVALQSVVESALETAESLPTARNLEVSVALPAEPVLVVGDPLRLGQIVSNLLNNAAKYTPAGGRVTVTLGERDGRARISVRDTGVGIPAADLERVFETFVRLPHDGVSAQWGLGLGLPLARRLAIMHGGTLRARSDGPGQGSEFVVQLPLAPTD